MRFYVPCMQSSQAALTNIAINPGNAKRFRTGFYVFSRIDPQRRNSEFCTLKRNAAYETDSSAVVRGIRRGAGSCARSGRTHRRRTFCRDRSPESQGLGMGQNPGTSAQNLGLRADRLRVVGDLLDLLPQARAPEPGGGHRRKTRLPRSAARKSSTPTSVTGLSSS